MELMRQKSVNDLLDTQVFEHFEISDNLICRRLKPEVSSTGYMSLNIGRAFDSRALLRPQDAFYQAWLKQNIKHQPSSVEGTLSIVDLFAGCGGMSLGIEEAGLASGRQVRHVLAAEQNDKIAEVYNRNLAPENLHVGDISEALDGKFGQPPTSTEKDLASKVQELDLLCGGPPCQGHSDLNNYTRRDDPRNSLYFLMARATEILRPKAVIVENVPGVRRDRTGNFGSTINSLKELGYSVAIKTLNAMDYGVPQSRKRTFVFAADGAERADRWQSNLDKLMDNHHRTPLWAMGDLIDVVPQTTFDDASALSDESQARVDWLFDNSKYELDDSMRPDCHRLKTHSYNSVYGRMRENTPAPTMTTGFLVMGQGRFIHPTRRRTITPHEGARIQTFPDFFDFGTQKRGLYARMIGNAVPPLLAYYVGLATLDAVFD